MYMYVCMYVCTVCMLPMLYLPRVCTFASPACLDGFNMWIRHTRVLSVILAGHAACLQILPQLPRPNYTKSTML
ncbi:hypothetical protein F4825DRAFT_422684 [Nemania diffusa]|nr:hypothetical protein F4825DRAFT_422684 [Nemania diffusa]